MGSSERPSGHSLPVPPGHCLFSVAAVRAIDRAAIETGGIRGYELMMRAAAYALEVAVGEFPTATRWQILCGSGNNAGDAWVLGRLAAARGIDVAMTWVADPERLAGDAATAWRDFKAAGGRARPFAGELDPRAELLVDGLLGSGLSRDVEGRYAAAVEAMNRHAAPAFALDVPTGIHGDSGRVMGVAVRAAATATFVALKTGLYLADGPEHRGRLHYSPLDVPASCFGGQTPDARLIDAGLLRRALPRRPRQAHKGDFGHVLVVGGGPGMPGAVCLAGEAALRAGCGRVSVATHPQHAALVPFVRPELMCHAVADAAALTPLLERATVIALGTGLGQSEWAQAMYRAAAAAGKPLVVDADGLNLLAAAPDARADRILTPHPGEAARLLGQTSAEVQADRLAALAALTERYGGTVVLKGCGSLVSAGDGPPRLCTAGNPGMATAGMGDTLTGIVAGLRAQGLDADTAAAVAVEAHARAADAAAVIGERGLLAGDALAALRSCLNP